MLITLWTFNTIIQYNTIQYVVVDMACPSLTRHSMKEKSPWIDIFLESLISII